jgi:hypothetical protein
MIKIDKQMVTKIITIPIPPLIEVVVDDDDEDAVHHEVVLSTTLKIRGLNWDGDANEDVTGDVTSTIG